MARSAKKKVEELVAPVAQVIDDLKMAKLLTLREREAALKSELRSVEKDLEAEETEIMRLLKAGFVTSARFMAMITQKMPQCRPSWASEFKALCARAGLNVAAEVKKVEETTRANLLPKDVLEAKAVRVIE